MSLNAYQAARARAETPRSAELRLLGEITGEMMEAEEKGVRGPGLITALHRNRQMWSTFSIDCGTEGNGLPPTLRAQMISLALFVDRFTSEVMADRGRIRELIDLNRTIMEGLRGPTMATS